MVDSQLSKQRARERAERIRKEIPILEVLDSYGYPLQTDTETHEQQFPCDLHGDGHDGRFSARVYPDTNTWYCWACDKFRDAINTLQEKEELNFSQACYQLEERFGLPHPTSWVSSDPPKKPLSPAEVVRVDMAPTYEEEETQTQRLLLYLTKERVLSLALCTQLWGAFDMVSWHASKGALDESQGRERMAALRKKCLELGSKAMRKA
jgi:hypothetical protein